MINPGCNLCGSTFYKVVYQMSGENPDQDNQYKITGDKTDLSLLRIVRCLKCGLVYVNPQETKDDIFRRYRDMKDDDYLSEELGRSKAAKILLRKISKLCKGKGRILDVGSAAGFLLAQAKSQGWEAYGVDLSQWAADFAKEKFGLNIFNGLLEDAKFPYNYFDAIVMTDSIEHIPDPKQTLQEIRRILKPGGVLCISTPDIDSWVSRLLKAKWWGIQQSHIYYFSKTTLNKMLDVCGFRVIKNSSHVRLFSFRYLAERSEKYSSVLHKFFLGLSGLPLMRNGLFRINFGDQIEVFARKKRSLSYIEDDEKMDSPGVKTGSKVIVVLPAFNAASTLVKTVNDIPRNLVDDIILVDDASRDDTVRVAESLGIKVFRHEKNKGYGANQKTCYLKALDMGADIVVMLHPDYQYDPTVIPAMIEPIQSARADAVFGSRMIKGGALEGGMPLWKHNINILLTAFENVVLGTYLTEYHSGFRAYSRRYLTQVNFMANSDKFIFDNQIIIQGLLHNMKIEEVPIKTRYFDEASTIKFLPSVIYGLGILWNLFKYMLHSSGMHHFKQFE